MSVLCVNVFVFVFPIRPVISTRFYTKKSPLVVALCRSMLPDVEGCRAMSENAGGWT